MEKTKSETPIQFDNYNNATILQYTTERKVSIVFSCEHATNLLPQGSSWSEPDIENFSNKHWAYDIKALDLAKKLAKEFKTYLVHSNYSRLFIDMNRVPSSKSLIKTKEANIPLGVHKGLTFQKKTEIFEDHWMSYQLALTDLNREIESKYAISIHSFNPIFKGKTRSYQVGVLNTFCDSFAYWFQNQLTIAGLKARVNEPYDMKKGANIVNTLTRVSEKGVKRECLLLEVRNDLLQDEGKFEKVFQGISQALRKLENPAWMMKSFQIPNEDEDKVKIFQNENCEILGFFKYKNLREIPKLRMIFMAENAGLEVPKGYEFDEESMEFEKKLGFGTKFIAEFLARKFKSIIIESKISSIFCDVSQSISNINYLIPEKINFKEKKIEINFNQNLSYKERNKRIKLALNKFYNGLIFIHDEDFGVKISCHFWLSILPIRKNLGDIDIVILSNKCIKLAEFAKILLQCFDYNVKINHSEYEEELNFSNYNVLNCYYPRKREALIMKISYKILESKKKIQKISSDLYYVMKELNRQNSSPGYFINKIPSEF